MEDSMIQLSPKQSDEAALWDRQDVPLLEKGTSTYTSLYQRLRRHTVSLLSLCMLLISLVLFTAAVVPLDLDRKCTAKLTGWSPMLPSISYSWRTLDPMISSIYTQPPSPKVEAAWNDLWTYGPTGIPDSALPLLNKSHSVHWLRHSPDTPKHGSQIKAFVEGYHRIHCLHLIRQYTYRHTYNFSAEHYYFWDQPPAQLLDHVEHCIENVRSAIKCNADVTPLLMEKIGRDMRVGLRKRAKCREWEGIKRWGGENTV